MAALTPKPLADYGVAELEFIDQQTRQMTVAWARHFLNFGKMTTDDGTGRDVIFLLYAQSKKWVSVDGSKLTSQGFQVAARFLKR